MSDSEEGETSVNSAISSQKPVSWKHIGLYGHSVGTFTCTAQGVQWQSALGGGADDDDQTDTIKNIPKRLLNTDKQSLWSVLGKSGFLRLMLREPKDKEGNSVNKKKTNNELRFDGFVSVDYDTLRTTLKNFYNVDLARHNMSSTGASFGNTNITGRNLVFKQCILEEAEEEGEEFEPRDGDEMMSINLTEVSQCVLPGNNRNEIELQFPESDTVEVGTDQLVAIRFYIPPDPDQDPSDKSMPSVAEHFQSKIMKTANIKNTAGNVIVEFDDNRGTFLTPRGRYTIELYDSFLRMRGNKYDYKIKYDDISRLFLLPKPDDVHMAFVIALDKPIRQGQQRYQYLVLQTTKDQSEVTINLDEDTLAKEYDNQLQQKMIGSLSNLIAKTFKVIAGKKVFIPGKFANANQQACVKCALRANEGHLYPLEKQFIFIHKPPVLVRFDEVDSVEFQRYAGGAGSTRNFDLCVTLKNSQSSSSGTTKEYTFSGIDRSDYAGLYNFLSGKKIRIKNLQEVETNATSGFRDEEEEGPKEINYNEGEDMMDDDESDEDFDINEKPESDEGDDSDDSDAGKDSDEFDSDVMDDDSDLEEARKKAGITSKKSSSTPKKVPKKKRPAKDSDDDDSDDDSDDEDRKPKKKKTKKALSPKKKGKKKKKDPNAPKKALTAYILYGNAHRAKIREDNPDIGFGETAKLISENFKKLSDEERKEWDDKAAADKKRYEREMANYSAPEDDSDSSDDDSDDSDSGKKKKGGKKKKDPNAPKKALSAYMFFMSKMRSTIKEKNPGATFGEIAKLVSVEFKALSSEEKKKYLDMAAKDKQRYADEMKDYDGPAAGGGGSKKSSKKPKKDPNAPKKPSTAFLYFSQEMRPKIKEENPKITFGEMGKLLGEKYKSISDEDKEKYDEMAKADKIRYKKEMESYQQKKKSSKPASDDDDGSDDDSDDDSDEELVADDDDDDEDDDDDSDDDSD